MEFKFLICRKFAGFKGNAYAGVEKTTTKIYGNGIKMVDVEESKQVQEFNQENVQCHPKFELDGNTHIPTYILFIAIQ